MSDYRFKIGDFASTGAGWPKISCTRGRPTNHSFSQKTRLNFLSCDIKIWTYLSSILSQRTHLTDRRTDRQTDERMNRQTEFSSLDRVCILCSAVKTLKSHKFRVGLHVTFALNDRRIPIQYPNWSAKGFGK